VSWHPFLPVLASTSFNGHVNLWTIQNLSEEELLKEKKQQEEEEAKR
jgi:hypothetical protein